MTGPNPDAELDEALGVSELPPAQVTYAHRDAAGAVFQKVAVAINGGNYRAGEDLLAQWAADLEQHAVARYIAERAAAGL